MQNKGLENAFDLAYGFVDARFESDDPTGREYVCFAAFNKEDVIVARGRSSNQKTAKRAALVAGTAIVTFGRARQAAAQ